VGCHRGGKTPLGRLADAELRQLKIQAHALFDPFWKAAIAERGWSKTKARQAAYVWLSKETGIPHKECHMGMMDNQRCALVIQVLSEHYEAIKKRKQNGN
jgi:hypothetical protein